jgi:dsRNA-specific ribonuclease
MNKEEDVIHVNQELLFHPFNPINKWISLSTVQTILKKYGVTLLNDFELYKQVFIHRSYCHRPLDPKIKIADCPPNCIDLQQKSNERLEFL